MGRYVVLGAAGFLGSHLCDALLNRGDSVVGRDDLSSGLLENISHLLNRADFEFLQCDITEGISVEGPVDGILNFASLASPENYRTHPLHTLRTGSIGTENALKLAAEKDARMVMASTSEIYGDPLEHPQAETYWGNVNPIGDRSCYDEAKRYAEAICTTYRRQLSVNTGIIRIFNTYGPRLRAGDGRVVSNFITQALTHSPISIYGDGTQTRSFCYVEDLVQGVLRMLDSSESGPVNMGSSEEITILELAKTVIRLSESASVLTYRDKPADDPVRRRPDTTLAKVLFDWETQFSLSLGIKRTIDWFRSPTINS
jgi:dTDP-glucose 4,6-dehydratase